MFLYLSRGPPIGHSQPQDAPRCGVHSTDQHPKCLFSAPVRAARGKVDITTPILQIGKLSLEGNKAEKQEAKRA